MQKLIIVESPAKCKKIEEYLGVGYKCMASFGHLRTLVNLQSIDVDNNYKLKFTTLEEKKKQINSLEKAIRVSDEIILASDDDREGEAIAWHICKLFGLPVDTTKRIIFHEITKPAILKSLESPTRINMNIVHAQHARQCLDILVGFKVTPLLWKHICPYYSKGLSSGRCQSPALRLIYDNAYEIHNCKAEQTNTLSGCFTKLNTRFILNKTINDENEINEFFDKVKTFDFILKKEPEKTQTLNPPTPFSTSLLQQKSNSLLNISPKDTMSNCQKLYEAGLITYMRTDNKKYSAEFCKNCEEFIVSSYGDKFVGDIKKNISGDKSAHEAIRPTKISMLPNQLSDDFHSKTKRLYELIWNNSIQSLMANVERLALQVNISAPLGYKFQCIFHKNTFDGWQIVATKKEPTQYDYMMMISNNSKVGYNEIESKTSVHNLKSHLSYSTLIKTLEDKGIGRPSTFASIVDKVISRGYVCVGNVEGFEIATKNYSIMPGEDVKITESNGIFGKEKNKLILQPLGFMVIDFLLSNIDTLFDYEFTSNMENELDLVENGESSYDGVCKSYDALVDDKIVNNGLSPQSKKKWSYIIDENNEVVVCKHGIAIKSGKDKFHKLKENVNMFSLQRGGFNLEDVVEECVSSDEFIGEYQGEKMYMKYGKYGKYVVWGTNSKSLNGFDKSIDFDLEHIIKFIENGGGENKCVVRVINENMSIRKGKYGIYIFYKTSRMNKPTFLKLKGFSQIENIETCNINLIKTWISATYNL